jgi:hypothetical protein
MTSVEHELLEKISHLDLEKQHRVLDFVRTLEESQPEKTYSAHELMKLPVQERTRIAIQALERSANEDAELFDAYGEADINDE